MMQFSVAPLRVLPPENAKLCKEAAELHGKTGDRIIKLAKDAAVTGEPIVRPMTPVHPDAGYETVEGQFMSGDKIVVAPVVEKDSYKRKILLPKGKWKGDDGKVVKGNRTIGIGSPLERIPFFVKME